VRWVIEINSKKEKLSFKERAVKILKNRYVQRFGIIVLAFIIGLFIFATPLYDSLNYMFYDLSLKMVKRPVKESDDLVLVDIDDSTLNADFMQFSWPFPRSVYGDALKVLRDFGVKGVVFDIEFIGKGLSGFEEEFAGQVLNDLNTDIDSIKSRVLRMPQVNGDQIDQETITISSRLNGLKNNISSGLSRLVRDNDAHLSNGIRYNGSTYGTVSIFDNNREFLDRLPEDERLEMERNLAAYGVQIENLGRGALGHPSIKSRNYAIFPLNTILEQYKKIGFTTVDHDRDGSTRRISLFMEKDGFVFPQLAFSPFLDIHNITMDMIDFSRRDRITIRDIELVPGKKQNLVIPLDRDGYMVINYPAGKFADIFAVENPFIENLRDTHFSFGNLLFYTYKLTPDLERTLARLIEINPTDSVLQMQSDYLEYKQAGLTYFDTMEMPEDLRLMLEDFFDSFLVSLNQMVSDEERDKILEAMNEELVSPATNDQRREMLIQKMNQIIDVYQNVNIATLNMINFRNSLKQMLQGKICFIGHTATGTTDIGSVPFDNSFQNVGIHPSIYNTILQNDFIRIFPDWLIFIFCIAIYSALIGMLTRKNKDINAFVGVIFVFILTALLIVVFRFTNIYISIVIPFIYGIVSFLLLITLKFVLSESEKGFIRNTFSRYLSPEVIKDLMSDPSKIELGGERRNCTAIFTDVEGFSSISERFMDDPKGLVSLLNDYLSAMSDIILDNGGTIDKYEGDAIIAFFGAPHQMDDHPLKACISSIRMKQVEDSLNRVFISSGIVEKPLRTRIGVNTGDMFVGNMGTYKRQDYTMMGHAVNLSARLEGVNKQYKTYQLISEYTYQRVKEHIVCRKLDRVRVVNINTPIRLYELISLKDELADVHKEFLDNFHSALDHFEKREWEKALEFFNRSIINEPYDETTKIYIDRCEKFIKEPPQDDWDGVYNLTSK